MNTSQVDYVDLSEERVHIANQLGANGIKMDFNNHEGAYDLVVNTTNAAKAIPLSIKWLKPGGVLSSANIYFTKKTAVPFFNCMRKI